MFSKQGFTLLELIIALMILTITITLGVPSLVSSVVNSRLTSQANDLVLSLNSARSESIKRSKLVAVMRTNAQWRDGWQVYVDDNGNQVFDQNEVIVQASGSINGSYTLLPDNAFADQIIYRPDGRSNARGQFVLCAPSGVADFRLINIQDTGRIQSQTPEQYCRQDPLPLGCPNDAYANVCP